jgi:hypothetical protein
VGYDFVHRRLRARDAAQAVFLGAVAILFLSLGMPRLVNVLRTSDSTTGIALEVDERCGIGAQASCDRQAIVSYTVDGVDYRTEMKVNDHAGDGQEVPVYFQPANPDVAISSRGTELWWGIPATFWGLVVLLPAIGSARRAVRGGP